jgi:hypothetical protein
MSSSSASPLCLTDRTQSKCASLSLSRLRVGYSEYSLTQVGISVVGFAIPADGLAVVTLNGKVVHSMATQALQLTLPDVPPGERVLQRVPLGVLGVPLGVLGVPPCVLRLPLGVLGAPPMSTQSTPVRTQCTPFKNSEYPCEYSEHPCEDSVYPM